MEDDFQNPILDGMLFALEMEESSPAQIPPSDVEGVVDGLFLNESTRSSSSAFFESTMSTLWSYPSSPDFTSCASSLEVSNSFLDHQCSSTGCCSATAFCARQQQTDWSQSAPADSKTSRPYNRKPEGEKTPEYYARLARSKEYVRKCRQKKKACELEKDLLIAHLQAEMAKQQTEIAKQTAISETLKRENEALMAQLTHQK